MTEEERSTFIKDKIAPLFDGMNAEDALEIITTLRLQENLFSNLILSLKHS
ncbi:hypothetical protein KJ656_08055 [bacterium]|nr:hypothetical protein [bacterium]